MFLPYYEITDGESGLYKIPWQSIVNNANSAYKRFNPYRDLQGLGTTLGFRGKNYWIADRTLLGKLLKRLYDHRRNRQENRDS